MPITATRLPCSCTEWSQRAVWSVDPANVSAPGMSGSFGWLNTPVAPITKRALIRCPSAVSMYQTLGSSSKVVPVTLVLRRKCPRTPYLSAQCSA